MCPLHGTHSEWLIGIDYMLAPTYPVIMLRWRCTSPAWARHVWIYDGEPTSPIATHRNSSVKP